MTAIPSPTINTQFIAPIRQFVFEPTIQQQKITKLALGILATVATLALIAHGNPLCIIISAVAAWNLSDAYRMQSNFSTAPKGPISKPIPIERDRADKMGFSDIIKTFGLKNVVEKEIQTN